MSFLKKSIAILGLLGALLPGVSLAQATVALPPQPGNANKFLQTDGLNLRWAAGGGGGGGGVVEGDPVTGCGPGEIIYDGPSGLVACDPNFTRVLNGRTRAVSTLLSAGFTDSFALESNTSIAGPALKGFNVNHTNNPGENAFLFIGDGTAAALDPYTIFLGYQDLNTGAQSRLFVNPGVLGLAVGDATDVTEIITDPTHVEMVFTNTTNRAFRFFEDTAVGNTVTMWMGEAGVDSMIQQHSDYVAGGVAHRDALGFVTDATHINFYVGTNRPTAPGTANANFIGNGSAAVLTGNANTAWGFGAGNFITSGNSNSLVGTSAGLNITSGQRNSFMGARAGESITTTNDNVAIGANTLRDGVATSTRGTFVGVSAGEDNVAGDNTFLGYFAGKLIGTGSFNVGVGSNALGNTSTTSARNVAAGYTAGFSLQGVDNVLLGYGAGSAATSMIQSVFIGTNAGGGATVIGDNNIGIGHNALNLVASGEDNVFIGTQAGATLTATDDNVGIGAYALRDGNGYDRVVAIGMSAGEDNIGDDNTFVGYHAGQTHSNGSFNTVVGAASYTGAPINGDHNTIVGAYSATALATGIDNVIVGSTAAQSLNGTANVIIGNDALQVSTVGTSNVLIGDDVATTNTTLGDTNVLIGHMATIPNSTSGSIGLGNAVAITAGNQFVVGSETSPITATYIGEGIFSATPTAVTSMYGTSGSPTGAPNIVGSSWVSAPGSSTGNAVPATYKIQTTTVGASGTTPQTYSDIQEWSSEQSNAKKGQAVNRTPVNDANYTVLLTDYLISYTNITASRTVTIPDASTACAANTSADSAIFVIKDAGGDAGTFSLVLDPAGGDTIDGAATLTMNVNFQSRTLISDCVTNWEII